MDAGFCSNWKAKVLEAIRDEWFVFYSRQFLVYKEMDILPEKFMNMGIRIRKFIRFEQNPIVKPYDDFQANRAKVAAKHYSRF